MRLGYTFAMGFLVGFTPAQQQNLVTGFALGLQEALNQSSHSGILKLSEKLSDQQKSELVKGSDEERIEKTQKIPKKLKSKL